MVQSTHDPPPPYAPKLKKDGAKMISYYPRNRRVLITLVRLPAGLCRFPLHTACKFNFKEFSGILL